MKNLTVGILHIILYPPFLIFLYLIPSHLLFFSRVTSLELSLSLGFSPALFFFSLACFILFLVSFYTFRSICQFYVINQQSFVFNVNKIMLLSTILATLLSIISVILSVDDAKLAQVFQNLISQESDSMLRYSILFDRTSPGIIAAMSFFALGNLYLLLSLFLFNEKIIIKKYFYIYITITIAVILFRSIIFADRMSIIGLILPLLYFSTRTRFSHKFFTVFIILGIVGLIAQTLLRGGVLVSNNPFFLYLDLCMANSTLSLQNLTDFSLGVASLFNIFTFIFRFFGVEVGSEYTRQYIWNPASCFLSYSINDFGYFGVISFIVLGAFSSFFYYRQLKSPQYFANYLFVLFGIISTFTVPIFRGPEFWFAMGYCNICFVLSSKKKARKNYE